MCLTFKEELIEYTFISLPHAVTSQQSSLSVGITVGITMGIVVVLLTGAVLAILYKLRRRKKYTERMQRDTHGSTLEMHRYIIWTYTFFLYISEKDECMYQEGFISSGITLLLTLPTLELITKSTS